MESSHSASDLPSVSASKATVNDIQYDYFGRRIATCSTDHHIRVYDIRTDLDKPEYILSSCWKAHNASVWRISWAHPEYGQILASCSFDRQVIIWEEILSEEVTPRATSPPQQQSTPVNWLKRVTLVDSRANVSDVRFAPKHFGLLVAFTSFDGSFRVYEASNTFNLSVWSMQAEVPIESEKAQDSSSGSLVWLPALSSLAWSNARHGLPLLAIGVDHSVQYGQSAQRRITPSGLTPSRLQCWQATGEPSSGGGVRKWKRIDNLNVQDRVRDVCFAPCNGRSFHLLAAAQDRQVALYTLSMNHSGRHSQFVIQRVASIHKDHLTTVERIRWNVTGSIVMSTDACGAVLASRASTIDHWELLDKIVPRT